MAPESSEERAGTERPAKLSQGDRAPCFCMHKQHWGGLYVFGGKRKRRGRMVEDTEEGLDG